MSTPITISMFSNQQDTLYAAPVNLSGSASVVGVPAWTTSDDTLVSLAPAADGMSCVVYGLGQNGTCQVFWTGQGQGGAVVGTATFNITSALANNVVMSGGIPVNQ